MALHIAVKEDNMNIVQHLLEEDKIDINIRDNFGNCALSIASKSGFLQIFDLLKFGKLM
jgi:ankyrin repeat protein